MLHLPILEYCMLLGAGRVVNRDISYSSLPPQQIGTLSVNVHDWKGFIILERVQSPSAFGNASLRGLVVLDHHPSECVGIFRECPRQFKVGLLLVNRSSICIIRSSFRLSKSTFLVIFSLLVVFPAPLIVLLPLSLLGGQRISFSMPVCAAVSLPWSVRFPPAPPLLRLVISSSAVITTGPMLISLLSDMAIKEKKLISSRLHNDNFKQSLPSKFSWTSKTETDVSTIWHRVAFPHMHYY